MTALHTHITLWVCFVQTINGFPFTFTFFFLIKSAEFVKRKTYVWRFKGNILGGTLMESGIKVIRAD